MLNVENVDNVEVNIKDGAEIYMIFHDLQDLHADK